MRRDRSGFLLPGALLTLLTCAGVTVLVVSGSGVLPDDLPVLRSVGREPRRSVPALSASGPSPTPRPTPSPTATTVAPTATPTQGPRPTRDVPTAGPTSRPTAGPTVTPSATSSPRPPAPPPPSCTPGSAKVTPVADAWVDQATPAVNYGKDQTLAVASRDKSRNGRALVRFATFAVPKGCTVRGVTLTMTAREATGRRVLVAPASGAWSESAVTWANHPWPTGSAVGATVSSRTVTWSLSPSSLGPNGFVLYDAAENAGGAGFRTGFAARDGRGAPTLTVRWS